MNNNDLPPIKRLTMYEARHIDNVCLIEVGIIGRILKQSLLNFDKDEEDSDAGWIKRFFTRTKRKKPRIFYEDQLQNVQALISHCSEFIQNVMMLTSIVRLIDSKELSGEALSEQEARYAETCDKIESTYDKIRKTDYGWECCTSSALWQIGYLYTEALRP